MVQLDHPPNMSEREMQRMMQKAMSGKTFDFRGTLPAVIKVRPDCICSEEDEKTDDDVNDEFKSRFPEITDAEIQDVLDEYSLEPARTVVGIKRTLLYGKQVHDYFYYGPNGPESLHYKVKERMLYVERVFSGAVEGARWWIRNVGACGAPDDICRTTMREQHYYYFNDRQITAYVRTGYDAADGELPAGDVNKIRIDTDLSY